MLAMGCNDQFRRQVPSAECGSAKVDEVLAESKITCRRKECGNRNADKWQTINSALIVPIFLP
jgi:hypothetical protein